MNNKDNTTKPGSTTGQPSVDSSKNEVDSSVQQSEDNQSSKDTVIFVKLDEAWNYIDPIDNPPHLFGPKKTTVWSATSTNGEQKLFVPFSNEGFSEEELTEFRNDLEGLGDFSVYNP
ncbi:uncharacterized protein L199_008561 [Kwoniella botswanensis]|uniref:uncharacterized protein n=1 Tax=Kwoniella botswanensis TaxID=1268659 RepID=UPI00315C84CD